MESREIKKLDERKLGPAKRKTVHPTQDQLILHEPLLPDRPIPYLIRPAIEGVDLIQWGQNNRSIIEAHLNQHRALLLRGFKIQDVERFEAFALGTSAGGLLEYVDRTTPRHSEGGKSERVYISTIYPAEHSINPHNEGTYWTQWALKVYFCCLKAPAEGGQTPIYDVHRVHNRIEPEIRQRFLEKRWMLVRNYHPGFGLPWQEVFQVQTRDEVERYCRTHDIQYEWLDGQHLRTRSIRPAIHYHPKTGDALWFNHATFYHHTSLDPTTRDALVNEFGLDGLPYNTWYGDGTAIDPEEIRHIREAYQLEKVMFNWQEGDILMLDNMYIAHARQPYVGERRIVVAMTEPVAST